MITLHTFGPAFGLPDPSPFVCKAQVLLKMSDIGYGTKTGGPGKAPKGKLPFIDDDGTIVADSTLIRVHLEQRYGIDFDAGLSAEQKGAAWAAEKMCEDHLYWIVARERWMIPANFDNGPRAFFKGIPVPLRPAAIAYMKRNIRSTLHRQGLGRMTPEELAVFGDRAVSALAGMIADKPWLMGETPCGADATVWSFVAGGLCDRFEGPVREAMQRHPNLPAYRDRGMTRWFTGLAGTGSA